MQINYLIDEAVDTGKGSNSVISYLHHYFTFYSMGAIHLSLHADNCSGQNKNNIMLQVRVVAWYNDYYLHFTVSFVESTEWSQQIHLIIIHGCRAYKVYARLMLWPAKAKNQTHTH